MKAEEFKKWWEYFKKENKIDPDLIIMIDCFVLSKKFTKNSIYWNALAKKHIKYLVKYGVENFKQTIERKHYFGEGNAKLLLPILNDKIDIEIKDESIKKKYTFVDEKASENYHKFTFILLNYVLNKKLDKYLDLISENSFGNPIYISYNNKKYSFSSLMSILETNIINKNLNLNKINQILEIGAGSGRTCTSIIKVNDSIKYTICDIPPTLFIAQKNIQSIFPNKRLFLFRDFENYSEIKDEFEKAEIKFITQDQLNYLPNKIFDLSIAIDCLHEMNKLQVENYFNNFDRLSNNLFFKSQVNQWAYFDNHKYNINNYPIKSNWKKILHEKSLIPNQYFDAIYKIN